MRLEFPENFSENGARPVQFLGPQGRLIGWARSFSDFMTVTDNTIVGGPGKHSALTRIAGCDVSKSDGHTVGKTFSRKVPLENSERQDLARSTPAANRTTTATPEEPHQVLTPLSRGGIQSLAYQTGRGRPASATGCPVSFVPIHFQPRTSSL